MRGGGGECGQVDGRNSGGPFGGGLLRDQVLLALLAVGVLGLGAGHVDVSGVGALVQQVVEGVQVVRLRRDEGKGKRGMTIDEDGFI